MLFCSNVRAAKQKGTFGSFSSCLQEESVGLLFFEPSTRTRMSFEKAVFHLGGHSMIMGPADSSLSKGETILDTFFTLYAMGIRTFIHRDPTNVIEHVSKQMPQDVVLINAGSGVEQHPTQGLLDAYTLWDVFEDALPTKKIVIVGNISHSRVARSNLQWMNALGMTPTVSGPPPWLEGLASYRVDIEPDFEKAVKDADAVMTLRIQRERMSEQPVSIGDYHQRYGVNRQKLAYANPNVHILHPGPIHYGVELSEDVSDHPGNLVLTQVHNGVWTRMVLLEQLHQARRGQ